MSALDNDDTVLRQKLGLERGDAATPERPQITAEDVRAAREEAMKWSGPGLDSLMADFLNARLAQRGATQV